MILVVYLCFTCDAVLRDLVLLMLLLFDPVLLVISFTCDGMLRGIILLVRCFHSDVVLREAP